MAAANIANIVLPGKFDHNEDKWDNYKEQLYFAFQASGPLESVQKKALVSVSVWKGSILVSCVIVNTVEAE